jgi:hypothetical protein
MSYRMLRVSLVVIMALICVSRGAGAVTVEAEVLIGNRYVTEGVDPLRSNFPLLTSYFLLLTSNFPIPSNTPGAVRTRDLRIRNPALCPPELRGQ